MFEPLRVDVAERLTAAKEFFAATHIVGGNASTAVKGLVFVSIYAAYEHMVRTAVQMTISTLSAKKYRLKNLSVPLLSIFLDAELQSIRTCSDDRLWRHRINIFEKVFSTDLAATGTKLMPTDGTHYRYSNLQVIFSALGIKSSSNNQHLKRMLRIDEVVENRNKIAHGRETPEQIGGVYTHDDILDRIDHVENICRTFLNRIERFCKNSVLHKRKR